MYDETTERRILAILDEPVSGGETVWTARLIAAEVGDVSLDHIWRILRKHGIHLQRRRSWCISTDPEFARKPPILSASIWPHPTMLSFSVWMRILPPNHMHEPRGI